MVVRRWLLFVGRRQSCVACCWFGTCVGGCWLLFVVRGVLFVVRCRLLAVRCSLFVFCCLPFVVCCLSFADCRLLCVACGLLFGVRCCLLVVVDGCMPLAAVSWMLPGVDW